MGRAIAPVLQSRIAWGLGFLVALLGLVGIGLVAYTEVASLAGRSERVERTSTALRTVHDLETQLIDAETGQRGYLLTQNPAYLKPYDAASAQIPRTLASLDRLTVVEPSSAARVAQLSELARAKISELRQTIQAAQSGERRRALARVSAGERLMNDFRAGAAALTADLRRLQESRRAEERNARLVSQGVLAATILVALLLVAGAALISQRFDERHRLLQREMAERVAAQAALARLKAAVESVNDAVVITDAQLDAPGPRIEYVNPAFERMTGYPVAEALGRSPRILQGLRTDRALLRQLREDLSTRQSFHGETINYRKDGTEFVMEWRISALRDAAGNVTHWVAIQRDATHRKRTEEYRETLLASERHARSEAERATRLKDEFVATLSHELRTPLNAIVGWASILKRDQRPDSVLQGIEVIERNARIQAQMVEDLLDMSRIVSGKLRVDMQKTDLTGIIEAAAASVRPTADAKGIRLETMIGSGGPINGDPARLQQVVWNLLSNAIKFTPRHGKVQIALRKIDSRIEIAVSDSGQGIRPEFLPFVFDRFRQADASTTRRHGGLGLGLSIVKSLVEMHGGTVEVRSLGEGLGSTFTVRLPLALAHLHAGDTSAGDPTVSARPDESPSLRELTILVVDDEADGRALARRVLEEAGAKVVTAGSVSEALAAFAEGNPDVLVSDIGMPERDGYDLIREVRAMSGAVSDIPAVALTALARGEDRRRALLAGYLTHLPKPVEPAELIAVIASLTGRTGRPHG